jgi:hypothetical protein
MSAPAMNARMLRWVLVAAALLGATSVGAQTSQPWSGRGALPRQPASEPASHAAQAVAVVGFTVGDMDRSIAFYTSVLDFQRVSDDEVAGSVYEQLEGVFGVRMRVVRLRLGGEQLQLTEYLAPGGRPAPGDSRSNDR